MILVLECPTSRNEERTRASTLPATDPALRARLRPAGDSVDTPSAGRAPQSADSSAGPDTLRPHPCRGQTSTAGTEYVPTRAAVASSNRWGRTRPADQQRAAVASSNRWGRPADQQRAAVAGNNRWGRPMDQQRAAVAG